MKTDEEEVSKTVRCMPDKKLALRAFLMPTGGATAAILTKNSLWLPFRHPPFISQPRFVQINPVSEEKHSETANRPITTLAKLTVSCQ